MSREKKKQIDENITKKNRIPEDLMIDVAEYINLSEVVTTSSGSIVSVDDYAEFIKIQDDNDKKITNKST